MRKDVFESLKNCIESYAPEKRAEVKVLLSDYADGLRKGNLNENDFRSKALKIKLG